MKPHQSPRTLCCDCCGTGHTDDYDAPVEDATKICETCAGSGLGNWSWEEEDVSQCDMCHGADVPVSAWDENGENGQCTYICAPCARAFHADHCGCDAEGWALAGPKASP